ncbi:MAG: DUF357 domain-containing protein [Candidatus Woesearchaeota archaeon]|nr:DUF357 domain-containing protein [Candidatus Woesearchaeota archaeon]
MDKVEKKRLENYFKITQEALEKAKATPENLDMENAREDFLKMVESYIADAKHFEKEKKIVDAFAAINYAHGWLDAGARIGLWDVDDNKLFTRDAKTAAKKEE